MCACVAFVGAPEFGLTVTRRVGGGGGGGGMAFIYLKMYILSQKATEQIFNNPSNNR